MTINFQYNSLTVLPSGSVSTGNIVTLPDDTDWSLCFKELTEGKDDIAVRCSDPRKLVEYLHKNYINVKAAGGIVEDSQGCRLLMVRNDRYDLPKGKVEAGETIAQAALRETCEETGLEQLVQGRLLLKTYHIYNLYGGWHFKQTSWFAMKTDQPANLLPQSEEGITELQWLDAGEWRKRLGQSYATMKIITAQVTDRPLFM